MTTKLSIGLLFTLTLSAQSTQQPSLGWFSQSLQRLVEQFSPAVVQVNAQGLGRERNDESATGRVRTERGAGSGVILDPDGYIVTNAHVVENSTRIQVLVPETNSDKRYASILKPAGKVVDAEVVGVDRETDIAVLKAAISGCPALKLGEFRRSAAGRTGPRGREPVRPAELGHDGHRQLGGPAGQT
jgi:S1-C subfamily serine protease